MGQALAREFSSRGYEVVVLTRTPRAEGSSDLVRQVAWDGKTQGAWSRELDGAKAVVNLTGRNVNCRYHAANRREILESRVDSVRAVDAAIRGCQQPPKVLIQTATLAIVGDAGD